VRKPTKERAARTEGRGDYSNVERFLRKTTRRPRPSAASEKKSSGRNGPRVGQEERPIGPQAFFPPTVSSPHTRRMDRAYVPAICPPRHRGPARRRKPWLLAPRARLPATRPSHQSVRWPLRMKSPGPSEIFPGESKHSPPFCCNVLFPRRALNSVFLLPPLAEMTPVFLRNVFPQGPAGASVPPPPPPPPRFLHFRVREAP